MKNQIYWHDSNFLVKNIDSVVNMSDKVEFWLEGHAEDRSWCAELISDSWGGDMRVMDGWTTQISISF